MPEQQQRDRPPLHRADARSRSTRRRARPRRRTPAMPIAGGEELEDDQREARRRTGSTRPTACPSVCASCCARSSLRKRTSWFGCRLRSLPSPITSACRASPPCRRPCTVWPSSATMKSPTVGCTASTTSSGRPSFADSRSIDDRATLSVLRPLRLARRALASDLAPGRVAVSSKSHRMHRTDARARRDRDDRRAEREQRARTARVGRPRDRPTRRPEPSHSRPDVDQRVHVDVDRARRRRAGRRAASTSSRLGLVHDVAISAAFGGSIRPLTCTTSMPFASARGRRRSRGRRLRQRERERRAARDRTQQHADSAYREDRHRALVACGRWRWRSSAPPPTS